MKMIIRSSNGDLREQEITGDMNFTPTQGEHLYFTEVQSYTFNLVSDNTGMNVYFITNDGQRINIVFENMANLIQQNDPLDPFSIDTIFGVSTNAEGDKQIETALNNPEFESGEIVEALKAALSLDGSTLAGGAVIDDFQAMLDNMAATAAGAGPSDTAFLSEDDRDQEATADGAEDDGSRPENPEDTPPTNTPPPSTPQYITATASLSGLDVNEDQDNTTFTLNLSEVPFTAMTMVVNINGTPTTYTIPAGTTSFDFDVTTKDSDVYIDQDTVTVSIISLTGGGFDTITLDNDSVTINVNDTIDITTVTLSSADVSEDTATATFTIQLDNDYNDYGGTATVQVAGEATARIVNIDSTGKGTFTVDTKDSDAIIDGQTISAEVTGLSRDTGTTGGYEKVDYSDAKETIDVTDTENITTVTLSSADVSEDTATATFTIQLDNDYNDYGGTATVQVAGEATARIVNIDSTGKGTFTVDTKDSDAIIDGQTISAEVTGLSRDTGTTGGYEKVDYSDAKETIDVTDTENITTVTLSSADVSEDTATATFTIQLDNDYNDYGGTATVQVAGEATARIVNIDSTGKGTFTVDTKDSDAIIDGQTISAEVTGLSRDTGTTGGYEKVDYSDAKESIDVTDTENITTVTLSSADVSEDTATATFTIQLDNDYNDYGGTATVQVAGEATARIVNIDSTGKGTFTVDTKDSDAIIDGQTISAEVTGLSRDTGTTGGYEKVDYSDAKESIDVTDTENVTTVTLSSADVSEDTATATFTIQLDNDYNDYGGTATVQVAGEATARIVNIDSTGKGTFTVDTKDSDAIIDGQTISAEVTGLSRDTGTTGGYEKVDYSDAKESIDVTDTENITTVTLSSADVSEDTATATFTIQLDNDYNDYGGTATVQVAGEATARIVNIDSTGKGTFTVDTKDSDAIIDGQTISAEVTGLSRDTGTTGGYEKVDYSDAKETIDVTDTENITTVTLSSADVSEDTATATFTIQLDNDYNDYGGTATVQVAGEATARIVNIDSTGKGTFTVDTKDSDAIIDGQTISAEVTGLSRDTGTTGGYEKVDYSDAKESIDVTDTENITTVTLSSADVSEDTATATFTIQLDNDYNDYGGTATVQVAGEATARIVNIDSTGKGTFTVDTKDSDAIIDGQTISAEVTGLSRDTGTTGGYEKVDYSDAKETIDVTDTENITTVTLSSADVSEDTATATFTIQLDNDYNDYGGTATVQVAGEATARIVNIDSTGKGTFTVDTKDSDAIIDGQTISAEVTGLSRDTGTTGGYEKVDYSDAKETIDVTDTENITTVTLSSADVSEDTATATFTIQLDNDYNDYGGTATVQVAGEATARIVNIDSTGKGTFTVDTKDSDAIIDGQTISAEVTGLSRDTGTTGGYEKVDYSDAKETIDVTDTENITTVTLSSADVSEDTATATFTIQLDNDYNDYGGTATVQVAGEATARIVNIDSTGKGTFTVDTKDSDAIIDGQTISAEVTGLSRDTGTTGGYEKVDYSDAKETIDVTDTENITTVTLSSADVSEDTATATFTIQLDNDYNDYGGTATVQVAGEATARIVNIDSTGKGTFTVDTKDSDAIIDGQTISAEVTGLSRDTGTTGGYEKVDYSDAKETIDVTDTENITTVTLSSADVSEDTATATFTIQLDNDYNDYGGTATVQVAGEATARIVNIDSTGKGTFTVDTKDSDAIIDGQTISAEVTGLSRDTGTTGGYEKVDYSDAKESIDVTDTENVTTVTLTATPEVNEDSDPEGDGFTAGNNITYTASLPDGVTANNDITVTLNVGANGEPSSNTNPALVVTIIAGQSSGTITATEVNRDNDGSVSEDVYKETDSLSAAIVSATEENAGENGSLEKLTFDNTAAVTTIVDDEDLTSVSISGTITKTSTIDINNVDGELSGVDLYAVNRNGDKAELSIDTTPSHAGFGVQGSASGATQELGYHGATNTSEKIVAEFDNKVESIDVAFSWRNPNEEAVIKFFDENGDLVGSVLVSGGSTNGSEDTTITYYDENGAEIKTESVVGGSDKIDPTYTFDLGNGNTFNKVEFSAPGNDDDYLINKIDYKEVVDANTPNVIASETEVTLEIQTSNPPQIGTTATATVVVYGDTYQVVLDENGRGTLDVTLQVGEELTATVTEIVGGNFELVDLDGASWKLNSIANDDTFTATEIGTENITSEDSIDTENGIDDGVNVSGNLLENDIVGAATLTAITIAGTEHLVANDNTSIELPHGTLVVSPDGTFTFTVDNANSEIDALNIGQSIDEVFTYTLSDETTATATINIDGRDDAPVINSITANNQPLHTVDGLLDINNDGIVDTIDADALTNADRGLIFSAENGDLNINMGVGGSSMSVEYNGGQAGFHNALGYYTADENGLPTEAHIIYVEDSAMVGSQSELIGTLNNLEGNVGFFIIPDGGDKNVTLNSAISFDSTGKILVDGVSKTAYFSDNNLNTDGKDHVVAGQASDGSGLVLAFEDLNLGDRDYDDVVITINTCATLGTSTETILLTEDFEGVSKDIGAGDTNDGGSWYVDHGTNEDKILVSNSGISWNMNDAGIEMRENNGVDGVDTANNSDNYVELDAHTSGTNSSITTTVDLGTENDSFTLSFNFMARQGHEDSSDMKFSLDGKEVIIDVDSSGNITYNAPDGVSVNIEDDSNGWSNVTATFTGISSQSAELNFQSTGNADTFGAYLDNIKLVGTDSSTANTILSDVSLSDVDDTNLESATVTLTNYQDGDVIGYSSLPTGITATITNGVVALSGTATVEDYETALESLTFETTSDNRDPRTFEFTVNDGDKTSNTMEVSVDIGGCSLNTGSYTNSVDAINDYGKAVNAQGEFTVAAFEDGKDQSEPDVASLKDGGYVVAWTEVSGNTYKSAEVNDLNNDGDVLDSGETIWKNGLINHDVFIQRYDADGEVVGDATRVNTFVTNVNADGGRSQHDVNVVGLENDNYLVTWTSDDQYITQDSWDNGSRYIQGQIYDVNGNPICEEFTVSRAEYDPIVALPDGGFIVTWSADARLDNTDKDGTSNNNPQDGTDNPIYSDSHDSSGFGVIAQRFDALGNEVGERVIVNQNVTDDQMDSDIVMLDNDTAIMTWQSQNGTDGDFDIHAQTLQLTNNGLEVVSNNDIVVADGNANQTNPEVTASSNGTAVITYQSDSNIMIRAIDSNGTVGNEMTVSTGSNPVITAIATGFVIAYEEAGAIYTKTFDGTNLSNATQISDGSNGQTLAAVTTLEDGGYVISWQDDNGISAHRFNADGTEYHQNEFDMLEDNSIIITADRIMENDNDPEGHTFEVTSVQDATNGSVTMDANGNITFTPEEDYNGPATFTYTIKDELGAEDTATVFLNVKPQGEPTIFVGTLCDADIQSHNIIVEEGEAAILAVKVSGAEAGSTVSLTLTDGTALVTEDYEATFSYSFDGTNWTTYDSNNPISIPEGASKFAVKMDTVENTINENDELFSLSATLSTGENDIGTVTILDDDTNPPVADAVLTTSNLDTDDAVLSDFATAIGIDETTELKDQIAFFKKLDIGDGLDGTDAENDSTDPADLGGEDIETAESNLVFDITSLPAYGDLYIEVNGTYTKLDTSNLDEDSTLLNTADNVYWSATHDQVPEGDEKSIGGIYGNGIQASWENDDVAVIARDGNNQEATISYSSSDGIGVTGNTGGPSTQLGYDADEQKSESIIFDFENPVTDAQVAITHLIKGESGGEVGTFEAFLDGKSLGEFTFTSNDGVSGIDYYLRDEAHGTGNPADTYSGTIVIDNLVFDQLIFSAQEYVNQNGNVTDSSDYFIGGITYHEVPDVEFKYKVIDESDNSSEEVKVVINVATDTPVPEASANVAPTTTDDSITTNEDTSYILAMSDFGTYSDETAAQQVSIESLPENGVLKLDGQEVSSGTEINISDITAGKLVFTPSHNTDNDSNFTFKVSDGELWSNTQTTTVGVTAVADAPTASIEVTKGDSSGSTVNLGNLNGYTEHNLGNLSSNQNIDVGNGKDHVIIGDTAGGTNIKGGNGNDIIQINGKIGGNTSVDGGNGKDTLVLGKSESSYTINNYTNNNGVIAAQIIDKDTDETLTVNNIEEIQYATSTVEYTVNISATLADTDGSESLTIQLNNVPDDASFNLDSLVSQGNGVWELTVDPDATSIDYDNIKMTTSAENVDLTITATATEDNDDSSVSLTTDVDNINTLLIDSSDDESIDLSAISRNAENIDVIDFTDGENQTIDIDVEDIVNITDEDNELIIRGDNGDIINLDENDGWQRSETTTNIDGEDFTEYTNTNNTTISVFIDNDLDTTGLN